MERTKEAIDKFLAAVITAISSQKFWFSLLGMAATGYVAWLNQGDIVSVVAAILGFLGIPVTFITAKTYQNTHGMNAPEVLVEKARNGKATTTASVTTFAPKTTNAPVTDSVTTNARITNSAAPKTDTTAPAPVPQIKDKIKSVLKSINHETKWEVLFGTFRDTVERMKKRMLDMHPDWDGMQAVESVLNQFAGGVLSEEDCANVQSYLGLPAVIHAKNDVLILKSLQEAEKNGTLGKAQSEALLQAAKRYAAKDIVDDAVLRIQKGEGNAESRLALQEFGYTPEEARKAVFAGGYVHGFDPWGRAGVDPFGAV